jgi:hypothetical protein
MKKNFLAITLAFLSVNAVAETPTYYYVEASYARLNFEKEPLEATPKVGTLKMGGMFNKNFGSEILLGKTVKEDTAYVAGHAFDVKIDYMAGAYLKGNVEVIKDFEIFVRGGATGLSGSSESSTGAKRTYTGADFSYGLGLQYHLSRDLYLQADYMRYYNRKDISIEGPSISLGFKF